MRRKIVHADAVMDLEIQLAAIEIIVVEQTQTAAFKRCNLFADVCILL